MRKAGNALFGRKRLCGAELLPMGTAGAKAMAVVRGEADIYLHSGGQYEWIRWLLSRSHMRQEPRRTSPWFYR